MTQQCPLMASADIAYLGKCKRSKQRFTDWSSTGAFLATDCCIPGAFRMACSGAARKTLAVRAIVDTQSKASRKTANALSVPRVLDRSCSRHAPSIEGARTGRSFVGRRCCVSPIHR